MQIYIFLPSDARLEEDVAKGRRDWAYSERDKVLTKTTKLIMVLVNDDDDYFDGCKQNPLNRHVQNPAIAKKECGWRLGSYPWKDQLAIFFKPDNVRI